MEIGTYGGQQGSHSPATDYRTNPRGREEHQEARTAPLETEVVISEAGAEDTTIIIIMTEGTAGRY